MENNDEILTKFFLNPTLVSTASTEVAPLKRSKDYKIKNRGSVTSTNFRSPSTNKDKYPESDNSYHEFKTTSLEHLELGTSVHGHLQSKML
jgi:hypothetical protein